MSKLIEKFGFRVKEGDTIFREGDKAEFMYMIHSGEVVLSKGEAHHRKILRRMSAPEFFGEMAVISDAPRSASALAVTDCALIMMDRPSFEQSVRENHVFAISIIRMLTERLRETTEVETRIAGQRNQEWVISHLYERALQSGRLDVDRQWVLVPEAEFIESLDKDDIIKEEAEFHVAELHTAGRLGRLHTPEGDPYLGLRLKRGRA